MSTTRKTAAKTASKNALPEVFKSKAPIANEYGNVKITNGEIRVSNFVPDANKKSLVNWWFPYNIVRGIFINEDDFRREFIVELGYKIKGREICGKPVVRNDAALAGADSLIKHAYVAASFKLCKEGEEFTYNDGNTGRYNSTYYEVIVDSIKFYFTKEEQELIDKKDFEHFIKRSSIEEFEPTTF